MCGSQIFVYGLAGCSDFRHNLVCVRSFIDVINGVRFSRREEAVKIGIVCIACQRDSRVLGPGLMKENPEVLDRIASDLLDFIQGSELQFIGIPVLEPLAISELILQGAAEEIESAINGVIGACGSIDYSS